MKVCWLPKPEIPDPHFHSDMDWADNSAAVLEDKSWPGLDEVKARNDSIWLRVYGWILVALTVTFAVLFIVSIISWSWHYLGPVYWHWLNEQQLSKVQSVIFSGGLGAILSSMVQKQMSKAD